MRKLSFDLGSCLARVALLIVALSALLALPAAGLGLYPNPLTFDDGSVSGQVELVGSVVGALPTGGQVLHDAGGAGIQADHTVLMFRASFDQPEELSAILFSSHPLPGDVAPGVIGWVPGPDTDVASAGPFSALVTTLSVKFDTGLTASPVTATDLFFISYAPLTPGGATLASLASPTNPGILSFDLAIQSHGFVFTPSAQLVPEPGTGLLLAAGLIGLAASRRRNAA